MKYIANAKEWIVDSTFRTVPLEFYQLLTLQGKIFGKFLPFIFILMNNKTEKLYDSAFKYIVESFKFNPKIIVCDFEIALKNSCKKINSDVIVNGCLFHYGQSIYRKVVSCGLAEKYKNDIIFSTIIKMFMNLPFFNIELMHDAFLFIISEIKISQLECYFTEFIEYFEKYYYNPCSNSIYDVKFWSVYDRIVGNYKRTTNTLEGWHRGFNSLVGMKHANLGRFVDSLRTETEKIRIKIIRLKTGKFDFKNVDLKKESILKIIIENQGFWDYGQIFKQIHDLYKWDFNNK